MVPLESVNRVFVCVCVCVCLQYFDNTALILFRSLLLRGRNTRSFPSSCSLSSAITLNKSTAISSHCLLTSLSPNRLSWFW